MAEAQLKIHHMLLMDYLEVQVAAQVEMDQLGVPVYNQYNPEKVVCTVSVMTVPD